MISKVILFESYCQDRQTDSHSGPIDQPGPRAWNILPDAIRRSTLLDVVNVIYLEIHLSIHCFYYAKRVCGKRIKTLSCPSVPGATRTAAAKPHSIGNGQPREPALCQLHRRLHMISGSRKFWSECKEVHHTVDTILLFLILL